MLARLNKAVAALNTASPFLGGKALERRRGRPFRARLGANECLFGISDLVKAVWEKCIAEGSYYNDPTHYDLRQAVSAQWHVGMEHIAVAQGIDGLIELLVRSFVEPGDAVVTSYGAYPTFEYHALGCGAKVFHQPYLQDGANDLEGLLSLARQSGAKLLFLANPDNPTGSFFPLDVMQRFIARVPQDCLLLLDEAYVEFASPSACLPTTLMRSNVVRLRTFSKAYGLAGARVGYMIGPERLVETLDRIRLHFGVSKMSQDITLAAYEDTTFLNHVISATQHANKCYVELANEMGIETLPSSANFVSFDFGSAPRAAFIERWLDKNDVFIRRPPVEPLNRLIRVTAAPEDLRGYFAQVFGEGVAALRCAEDSGAL